MNSAELDRLRNDMRSEFVDSTNYAGRAVSAAVRTVLLALMVCLLKSAQYVGLFDERLKKNREVSA